MVESGEFTTVIDDFSTQFEDLSDDKADAYFYAINNQSGIPANAGSVLITINRYQINGGTGHYIYMTAATRAYYGPNLTNEGVAYRCFNDSETRGTILYRYRYYNGAAYTSYNYFPFQQSVGRDSENRGFDLDGTSGRVLLNKPIAITW
jgi:hypothetical protein